MLQTTWANIVQNFKNSIMPNIFKLRNAVFLKKAIFGVIEFFYFLCNTRFLWYNTAGKI